MKLRKFKIATASLLFLTTTALFYSCAESLEVGKPIDESAYNGIYENNISLKDDKSNLGSTRMELYSDSYKSSVRVNLTKPVAKKTDVTVKINAAYLDEYNKKHNTDFSLYPEALVAFDNEGVITIEQGKQTANLGVTITADDQLQDDKTYVLPIQINEAGSDLTMKNDASSHCVYLIKDMRSAGDAYKGEDAVRGFLFFEVNDTNPLNALSFKLENGKYLWDVVVLFAANINYDIVAGRPKIQCNPNVQFLLDNNEKFLQPLRKRGIKVLLGLLGNHDIAGLAQLSDTGAKDFAREVAQYCKAYNLDGVNYDDEYSKSPDLSNPSLTAASTKAAARLCYETKLAMPDKLVTVFDFGRMYGTATVDGVDASEFIDVVVPNYGSEARPIGSMTNKACAGAAMEFHLGIGTSLTEAVATKLLEKQFGWFMGFAPEPSQFGTIYSRLFRGANVLYPSPLVMPTVFYKKDDTTPYNYPSGL